MDRDHVTTRLEFRVYGDPIPQGSHRVIGSRVIPDKRLLAWRALVTAEALAAAEAAGWEDPYDGPVVVRVRFYLPRPATVTRAYPTHTHAGAGDVDKLTRSVLDALSPRDRDLRVLTNDARVIETHDSKHYADGTNPPGVHVQIGTIA